jgi:hypothetical protein
LPDAPPLPVVAPGVPVLAFDAPPDVDAEDVLLASFWPVVLDVVSDFFALDLAAGLLEDLPLFESAEDDEPCVPDIEAEEPEEVPDAPDEPGAESPAFAGRLSLALPVSLVP